MSTIRIKSFLAFQDLLCDFIKSDSLIRTSCPYQSLSWSLEKMLPVYGWRGIWLFFLYLIYQWNQLVLMDLVFESTMCELWGLLCGDKFVAVSYLGHLVPRNSIILFMNESPATSRKSIMIRCLVNSDGETYPFMSEGLFIYLLCFRLQLLSCFMFIWIILFIWHYNLSNNTLCIQVNYFCES